MISVSDYGTASVDSRVDTYLIVFVFLSFERVCAELFYTSYMEV